MGREHHTNGYRVAAEKLRAREQQPCCLCGCWIDYTLRKPNPGSFAAEHVVPVRHGGTWRDGLLPAHLLCQTQQGGAVAAGADDWWGDGPRSSGVW